MNQEFNSGNTSNRFIFSDDFYNQLGDSQDNKIDSNIIESTVMPNVLQKKDSLSTVSFNNEFINKPVVEDIFVSMPEMNKDNKIQEQTESVTSELNVNESVNDKVSDNILIRQNSEESKNDDPININEIVSELTVGNNNDIASISKIDKNVEKEVMKLNVENKTKPTIVENGSWYEEPREKNVYRAVRNKTKTNPIIYDDDYYTKTTVILPNPQVEEINKLFKQPPVLNIDELLKEDILFEEKLRKEKQKEMEKNLPAIKSDLLDRLYEKEKETGKVSILARYGEDFCSKDYITNPAIGREEEIKELILILIAPEKSAILVGKPGIGKTAIVEGLAYRLQRNLVPDVLKGYSIVSVKTTSLFGTLSNGETRLQTLIDEIKDLDKIILFIDEVHMLMGATKESSLDFANMFKESLGRGSIKMIGATTSDEYERYVLRDKAFARRFQRVDVLEPSREHTIEILMGSLPKIENNTGAKLKYSEYIKTEIMGFIVDITSEYKRVYGIGSRYPDICLTLLTQAFSQAVFENRKEVNIFDVRKAIEMSKNIYPDVIRKELINFDRKFEKVIKEDKIV